MIYRLGARLVVLALVALGLAGCPTNTNQPPTPKAPGTSGAPAR